MGENAGQKFERKQQRIELALKQRNGIEATKNGAAITDTRKMQVAIKTVKNPMKKLNK